MKSYLTAWEIDMRCARATLPATATKALTPDRHRCAIRALPLRDAKLSNVAAGQGEEPSSYSAAYATRQGTEPRHQTEPQS